MWLICVEIIDTIDRLIEEENFFLIFGSDHLKRTLKGYESLCKTESKGICTS